MRPRWLPWVSLIESVAWVDSECCNEILDYVKQNVEKEQVWQCYGRQVGLRGGAMGMETGGKINAIGLGYEQKNAG